MAVRMAGDALAGAELVRGVLGGVPTGAHAVGEAERILVDGGALVEALLVEGGCVRARVGGFGSASEEGDKEG